MSTVNRYPVVDIFKTAILCSSIVLGITACGGSDDPGNGGNGGSAGSVVLPTTSLVAKTGQTLCYDAAGATKNCLLASSQDGAQLAGVAWPVPRFSLNSDSRMTDTLTGLAWAPDANMMPTRDIGWDTDAANNDGKVSWQNALNYVAKLNAETYLGYSDWRLPNRTELASLAHYGEGNVSIWLNAAAQGFNNVQASTYWTSTSWRSLPSSAWAVNMLDGYLLNVDKDDINIHSLVWPVRDDSLSTPAVRLAQTGQTLCYDAVGTTITCTSTGQDGELQTGQSWPTTRFTNNTDTSRKDNLTTLSWAPHGNLMFNRNLSFDTDGGTDGLVNWQLALDYVTKLNVEQYLGHSDWRLPNVRELQMLMHAGTTASAWLNGQGFQSVQANYWTSTSRKATPTSAWVMNLLNGVPAANKTTRYAVWPVRGGA